jgi:hypothetical protein
MRDIESIIRAELERMGITPTGQQAQQQARPGVSIEEALSAAIGDRPATLHGALNDDATLGRIAGGPGARINGDNW